MPTTIEFNHATLNTGVSEADLLARVLDFEEAYLAPRQAFLFHALVTDGDGRYGHLVVASDHQAFAQAMEDCPSTPSLGALMAALDMDSMRTRIHRILEEDFQMPRFFGSFEQGVFGPKDMDDFCVESFLARASAVRAQYLEQRPEYLAQTVAESGDGLYSELVFATSLAHAEKTCAGYLDSPVCGEMMELCNPETCELTFWRPLLQRQLRLA